MRNAHPEPFLSTDETDETAELSLRLPLTEGEGEYVGDSPAGQRTSANLGVGDSPAGQRTSANLGVGDSPAGTSANPDNM